MRAGGMMGLRRTRLLIRIRFGHETEGALYVQSPMTTLIVAAFTFVVGVFIGALASQTFERARDPDAGGRKL
jgi:hypothetical protein